MDTPTLVGTMMPVLVKIGFLLAFVIFIPVSAACYYSSRSDQRKSELERYMKILHIEERDLFEQKNTGLSLALAVIFVTFLTACFWSLILFGGASNLIEGIPGDPTLTFEMAFLGAYLWGIQSITRRYSMNDLIPVTYYNLGARMIFACILSLVIYYLSEVTPEVLTSLVSSGQTEGETPQSASSSTHMITPIVGFLIGMFPQRGVKWLTDKFTVFAQKPDPSVRDLPLDMIEGITIYDRVRLQELGIDGCYDLANVDYVPCLFKTPYSPRILINWILQAKLCVYFGEHVKDLREHGIHTAWQINDHSVEELKQLVKSTSLTEDTLVLVKNLISNDHEIERLVAAQLKLSQYWSTSDEEVKSIGGFVISENKR